MFYTPPTLVHQFVATKQKFDRKIEFCTKIGSIRSEPVVLLGKKVALIVGSFFQRAD